MFYNKHDLPSSSCTSHLNGNFDHIQLLQYFATRAAVDVVWQIQVFFAPQIFQTHQMKTACNANNIGVLSILLTIFSNNEHLFGEIINESLLCSQQSWLSAVIYKDFLLFSIFTK